MDEIGGLLELIGKVVGLVFLVAAPVGIVAKLLIDSYLKKSVATALEKLRAENQKHLLSFEKSSVFYREFFPKMKGHVDHFYAAFCWWDAEPEDTDSETNFVHLSVSIREQGVEGKLDELRNEYDGIRIFLNEKVCEVVDRIFYLLREYNLSLPSPMDFEDDRKRSVAEIRKLFRKDPECYIPQIELEELERKIVELEILIRKELLG